MFGHSATAAERFIVRVRRNHHDTVTASKQYVARWRTEQQARDKEERGLKVLKRRVKPSSGNQAQHLACLNESSYYVEVTCGEVPLRRIAQHGRFNTPSEWHNFKCKLGFRGAKPVFTEV